MLCKDCIACNNCKTCKFARLISYSYGVYSSVMTRTHGVLCYLPYTGEKTPKSCKFEGSKFDGNGNS